MLYIFLAWALSLLLNKERMRETEKERKSEKNKTSSVMAYYEGS